MQWLPAILILPYLFLLLRIYRSLLKAETFNVFMLPVTNVSVIVACHNEEEKLPILLKNIAEQDYPKELFEVIIVDDNSTDRTSETVSAVNRSVNLIFIRNHGKGKKQAIRTGIMTSSGKLIITTDADCRMGHRWISTIASYFEEHKPDMIISPVILDGHPGFFGRFQEMEYLSLQGITAGSTLSGNATMCNGANLAFTRETYLNHMDNLHFGIESGDDIFLLHSLKQAASSKILWLESSDAVVTTASSLSIGSFMKQRRRWISKVKSYDDPFTILTGIVTFVTILLQVSVLIASFINPAYILVFIAIFLLKSLPDYLILKNTSGRYGKKYLMNWFLPVQFVYSFYVLSVAFYSSISFAKAED